MVFDKPTISDEDILEILQLYLNEETKSAKITNMGGIPNNNYRVQIGGLDLAIKIYSKGQSSIKHIEKEVFFALFMQQNGIATLSLRCGKNGQYLQFWRDYPVVCSNFISGKLLSKIEIDITIAKKVGAYIASFVETAAHCDIEIASPTDLCSTVEYVFQDINRQSLPSVIIDDLTFVLNRWEIISDEIVVLESSKKSQCVHMDLWPYNLILSNDTLYSIDFDDWMYTIPLFEIAVALLEFCMFKCSKFDWDKAQAIIGGYLSRSTLDFRPEELHLALQYLCVLWYGYNLVESDDYFDAQIYVEKLKVITTDEFLEQFKALINQ